jgi:tRNA(Ile2) C34 agmatinyltransferase TiaS
VVAEMTQEHPQYPKEHREHREAVVDQDRCPECGGELDTGWECMDCGYDAQPIAIETPRSP